MATEIDRRLKRLERVVNPPPPVQIHVVLVGEDGSYIRPSKMTDRDVLIRVRREGMEDNAPSVLLDR